MPGPTLPNYISGDPSKPESLKVTFPVGPWVKPEYQGRTVNLLDALKSGIGTYVDTSDPAAATFLQSLNTVVPDSEGNVLDPGDAARGSEVQAATSGGTEGDSSDPYAAFTPELPTDPASKPEDPAVSKAKSFYLELWGESAPKGYVEKFFKAGGDYFDFRSQQLLRPGAKKSPLYRSQAVGYATALADIFGRGF